MASPRTVELSAAENHGEYHYLRTQQPTVTADGSGQPVADNASPSGAR